VGPRMRTMRRSWGSGRRLLLPAGLLTVAALTLIGVSGAGGSSTLPCKHGCEVHQGTYVGHNDQGKHVSVRVGSGFLDYGSHKEGAHVIAHVKTDFVVHCNGVKSNVYVDSTNRGSIYHHRGHVYMGERYLEVLWQPDGTTVGFVRYRNPSCSGISHFTLHRQH